MQAIRVLGLCHLDDNSMRVRRHWKRYVALRFRASQGRAYSYIHFTGMLYDAKYASIILMVTHQHLNRCLCLGYFIKKREMVTGNLFTF